jgi:hypothetical protein
MVGRLKAGCGAALTISIKMGFLRYIQNFEIKLSKKRKILYVCANGGAVPAGAAWSHDQIPSDLVLTIKSSKLSLEAKMYHPRMTSRYIWNLGGF